jgi:hypothetical protein
MQEWNNALASFFKIKEITIREEINNSPFFFFVPIFFSFAVVWVVARF